ncbi:MAG: alanine/ornithine racemase family PLP-dependent enzyme [Acholeplasmataceae bacterium]|jgi:predicted amino acid racemase|nr:alanine/ornithine racemase family PLP-dependent enzyme [Acholeplasmataceae bacterium]
MLPKLHINLTKYKANIDYLTKITKACGLSTMLVSKVYCGDQRIIDIVNMSDVEMIADSKISNLEKISTSKTKVLLRIPQKSEALDVVKYAQISLNSEIDVIKELDEKARCLFTKHKIILMFDLGDLREGIYYTSFYHEIVKEILELENIELVGIGTNLTCYGGVIPSEKTLHKLKRIKDDIESTFHITLEIISGGNSSALPMVFNHELPSFINNLRIGEAFVLGRETAYGTLIPKMYDDVFTLEAEIIELKEKPSLPEGELGMDAFGQKVSFVDQGLMIRAILGVGRQEVDCKHLIPPHDVSVVGCSSDHLIVSVPKDMYHIGDSITFKLTYGGLLSLMTSPYMKREYHE